MAHIAYEEAFREAQRELQEIEQQLKHLQQRKETLQSLVGPLSAYLNVAGRTRPLLELHEAEHRSITSDSVPPPAWVIARDVLKNHGRPMAVPEIFRVMSAMGTNSRPDAVRIAMLRKPEIFFNQGNGLYGLTAWLNIVPAGLEGEAPDEGLTLSEIREATAADKSSW
jgi:hypothetical protein